MTKRKTYRDAIQDLKTERDRLQACPDFQEKEVRYLSFVRAINYLESLVANHRGNGYVGKLSPEAERHLVAIGRVKKTEKEMK